MAAGFAFGGRLRMSGKSERLFWWIAGGVLAVGALVLTGAYAGVLSGLLGGRESAAIDPDDPRQVSAGRVLYAEYCADCHGADLEGEVGWRRRRADGTLPAPPHDASGHTWHHDDDLLFRYTKHGGAGVLPQGIASGMPGFADAMGDAEIRAVLAFIKSRWPADIRARQAAIDRRSR